VDIKMMKQKKMRWRKEKKPRKSGQAQHLWKEYRRCTSGAELRLKVRWEE
jgi:hypothetical protein